MLLLALGNSELETADQTPEEKEKGFAFSQKRTWGFAIVSDPGLDLQ